MFDDEPLRDLTPGVELLQLVERVINRSERIRTRTVDHRISTAAYEIRRLGYAVIQQYSEEVAEHAKAGECDEIRIRNMQQEITKLTRERDEARGQLEKIGRKAFWAAKP
jgi:hypothetical protein